MAPGTEPRRKARGRDSQRNHLGARFRLKGREMGRTEGPLDANLASCKAHWEGPVGEHPAGNCWGRKALVGKGRGYRRPATLVPVLFRPTRRERQRVDGGWIGEERRRKFRRLSRETREWMFRRSQAK